MIVSAVDLWLSVGALSVLAGAVLLVALYMLGVVGPTPGADGSYALASPRVDKTGAAVVQQSGGKYAEAALRGVTFTATEQGNGGTPGTTVTSSVMFALYNPAGNNFRFKIQKVSIGYISGTLSSGTIYHGCNPSIIQTAPSSGTVYTPICTDIGNGAVATGIVRGSNATIANGKFLRPLCTIEEVLATTVTNPWQVVDDVAGEFVLEPGCSFFPICIMAGAGTSPLLSWGVSWTEERIV